MDMNNLQWINNFSMLDILEQIIQNHYFIFLCKFFGCKIINIFNFNIFNLYLNCLLLFLIESIFTLIFLFIIIIIIDYAIIIII